MQSNRIYWEETEILIIHKNRRRHPRELNNLTIDLSEWTAENIVDFTMFGKRKILEEFEQLVSRKEKEKAGKKDLSDIIAEIEEKAKTRPEKKEGC